MQRALLLREGRYDRVGDRRSCSGISARYPAGRCILFRDDCNTRKGIPALPFSRLEKLVVRRKPDGYPAEVCTLGDHIRKHRMDNFLSQPDVAKLLHVSADTVMYWETNRFEPQVMFYPPIISFLGYFPFDIDTSNLAGKIKKYRFEHGLSMKVFAKHAGVDQASVQRWEGGHGLPNINLHTQLIALLGS